MHQPVGARSCAIIRRKMRSSSAERRPRNRRAARDSEGRRKIASSSVRFTEALSSRPGLGTHLLEPQVPSFETNTGPPPHPALSAGINSWKSNHFLLQSDDLLATERNSWVFAARAARISRRLAQRCVVLPRPRRCELSHCCRRLASPSLRRPPSGMRPRLVRLPTRKT